MGRAKEIRREIQSSGSPLAGHSINQANTKDEDDGNRRLASMAGLAEWHEKAEKEIMIVRLPFAAPFRDAMFDFMVERATNRIALEDELTIPRRLADIAADVYGIFKEARKRGLQTYIVNPPDNLPDLGFYTRTDIIRHSAKYSYFQQMVLTNMARALPGWRLYPQADQKILGNVLPRAYFRNLTSADFTLEGPEAVKDRTETYGFTLSSIATALHIFPNDMSRAADILFPLFLEASRKVFK